MLALRPNCENCNKPLPPESAEARICSFECTFCADCVDGVLQNICPNCTGGFVARPIRPKAMLVKYPASAEPVFKPADIEAHARRIAEFGHIAPKKR